MDSDTTASIPQRKRPQAGMKQQRLFVWQQELAELKIDRLDKGGDPKQIGSHLGNFAMASPSQKKVDHTAAMRKGINERKPA